MTLVFCAVCALAVRHSFCCLVLVGIFRSHYLWVCFFLGGVPEAMRERIKPVLLQGPERPWWKRIRVSLCESACNTLNKAIWLFVPAECTSVTILIRTLVCAVNFLCTFYLKKKKKVTFNKRYVVISCFFFFCVCNQTFCGSFLSVAFPLVSCHLLLSNITSIDWMANHIFSVLRWYTICIQSFK